MNVLKLKHKKVVNSFRGHITVFTEGDMSSVFMTLGRTFYRGVQNALDSLPRRYAEQNSENCDIELTATIFCSRVQRCRG